MQSLPLLSLFLCGISTGEAFVTSRSAKTLSFVGHARGPPHIHQTTTPNLPRTFLNSGNGAGEEQSPAITNIDKKEMEEILSEVEGDNNNNYVIIDVRGVDEIMMGTGTMSDKVHILPLPEITAMAAFDMDEKSFEAQFNFPKPSTEDDTLVLTCKMGGRSVSEGINAKRFFILSCDSFSFICSLFSCRLLFRSSQAQAAQIAAMSGYKKIINYTGGADDWFGGEFVFT